MGSPYEGEIPNNFAGDAFLVPDIPRSYNFSSSGIMGSDAAHFMSLTEGFHVYVMGWVQYADAKCIARRAAFCRIYRRSEPEGRPRFHVVSDPDYEYED
jgi:hypothetical protein